MVDNCKEKDIPEPGGINHSFVSFKKIYLFKCHLTLQVEKNRLKTKRYLI